MCPLKRYVRLALPLGLIAAVAAVVRSRRDAEVWHMAVADTPEPSHDEGP